MSNNLEGFSYFKIIIGFTILLMVLTAGYFFGKPYLNSSQTIESPLAEEENADEAFDDGIREADGDTSVIIDKASEQDALDNSDGKTPDDDGTFTILILGIDRRHGDQQNWRTDVIQVVTLSEDRSRAVVTHIPRDVWAGSYKINALYNLQGPDAIKDKVEEVTGHRPDRIIRIDFDAFVWAVDSVGGLTIDVPVAFTDSSYPDDRNGNEELITVTFEEGPQTMDGETALIYTRSRKGTNGEGSDYARGRRQQVVMQAITDDFFRPGNLFQPKTAATLYNIATQKMYTDMQLSDAEVLFGLLQNYKDITVETVSLSTENHLVVPSNRAAYNGAWTLIAKNNDYSPVHNEINQLLSNSGFSQN